MHGCRQGRLLYAWFPHAHTHWHRRRATAPSKQSMPVTSMMQEAHVLADWSRAPASRADGTANGTSYGYKRLRCMLERASFIHWGSAW